MLLIEGMFIMEEDKSMMATAESRRIETCRLVLDVVKPGDKVCGKYLAQLKKEEQEKEEAAEKARQREEKREPEEANTPEEAASQPVQEPVKIERSGPMDGEGIAECKMTIEANLKDRRSIQYNNDWDDMMKTGIIDFTATNSFGGPTRTTINCHELLNK